jgi:hypothetical protein
VSQRARGHRYCVQRLGHPDDIPYPQVRCSRFDQRHRGSQVHQGSIGVCSPGGRLTVHLVSEATLPESAVRVIDPLIEVAGDHHQRGRDRHHQGGRVTELTAAWARTMTTAVTFSGLVPVMATDDAGFPLCGENEVGVRVTDRKSGLLAGTMNLATALFPGTSVSDLRQGGHLGGSPRCGGVIEGSGILWS